MAESGFYAHRLTVGKILIMLHNRQQDPHQYIIGTKTNSISIINIYTNINNNILLKRHIMLLHNSKFQALLWFFVYDWHFALILNSNVFCLCFTPQGHECRQKRAGYHTSNRAT